MKPNNSTVVCGLYPHVFFVGKNHVVFTPFTGHRKLLRGTTYTTMAEAREACLRRGGNPMVSHFGAMAGLPCRTVVPKGPPSEQ